MKTCNVCGAVCEDQMKFCANCGAPFEMAEAQPEDRPTSDTVEFQEAFLNSVAEGAEEAVPAEEAVHPEAEEAAEVVEEAAEAAEEAVEIAEETTAEAEAEIAEEIKEPAAELDADTLALHEALQEVPDQEFPGHTPAETPVAAAAAIKPEVLAEEEKPVQKRKERKSMSVFAVLSIIFGIVGVFAGGYACLLFFMDIRIALIFYLPSVLAILFGLLALRSTGRDLPHRGKPLAVLGIILGILAIVLWLVGTFLLRSRTAAEFGTLDIMSVLRVITSKI